MKVMIVDARGKPIVSYTVKVGSSGRADPQDIEEEAIEAAIRDGVIDKEDVDKVTVSIVS
jgi:hypothetical protein